MLAYIVVAEGEMQVIPVDVDLKTMTHITVRNRRFGRSLLLRNLHYYSIHDILTPVFLLSEADFNASTHEK